MAPILPGRLLAILAIVQAFLTCISFVQGRQAPRLRRHDLLAPPYPSNASSERRSAVTNPNSVTSKTTTLLNVPSSQGSSEWKTVAAPTPKPTPTTTKPTISTKAHSSATGVCNAHIHQWASVADKTPVFAANISVTDGGGVLLRSIDTHSPDSWHPYGTTLTAPKGPLPYDVNFKFLDGEANKKREDNMPAGMLNDIQIRARAVWSTRDDDTSKLPHCRVGAWNTHGRKDLFRTANYTTPDRQMDCRWPC